MVPESLLVEHASVSPHRSLKFEGNITLKLQYRRGIEAWSKVVSKTGDVDPKAWDISIFTEDVIYFNCENKAKEVSQTASNCIGLNHDGFLIDF